MSLRKAPKLDGFKKQEYGLDIDKDSARYRESGNQNNLSHCSVTDGPRDNMPANIFNQPEHPHRTHHFPSMPTTSTPRPSRLQRRTTSDGAPYYNKSSSSGYPSPALSMESSLDSSTASRRLYQHQQSIVPTTSTDSSLYTAPTANTPECYMQRSLGIENKEVLHHRRASRDEIEDVYKRTVRENFTHFTKQTHIKCISSLLVQKQLISHDECKSLNEIGTSLTFYTEILPKKGAGAYTLLRRCIWEETEHRGHTCLNELFVEEERKIGIVSQTESED